MVTIQKYCDEEYQDAGAELVPTPADAWKAEMRSPEASSWTLTSIKGHLRNCPPNHPEKPIHIEEVIHYYVTNMPAAVSYASTISLTNVTLPYALELANLGFVKAVKTDAFLGKGVNVYAGNVTNQRVASAHGLEYKPLEELI